MNLLILGGTGPTGRRLIEQGLSAGHRITALVRNMDALSDVTDEVTLLQGDATAAADVRAAMLGQDATISALGAGKSMISDVYPRAATVVIDAARENGVSRLVWLSSFGVGKTMRQASAPQKVIYHTMLRSIYAQKEIADAMIRASGLDWTLVYPVNLTHGPATTTFRVDERLPMKGLPSISRADVARFMLGAASDHNWIKRSPIISD